MNYNTTITFRHSNLSYMHSRDELHFEFMYNFAENNLLRMTCLHVIVVFDYIQSYAITDTYKFMFMYYIISSC